MKKVKTQKKSDGQYMTPKKIVNLILDTIGFVGNNVFQKKIIEPSFGTGNFLLEIVERIIIGGKQEDLSNDEIGLIIQNHVFGIEKDVTLYDEAISRLNSLLWKNDITNVDWKNLICGNTLVEYKKFKEEMDYVVGNPPFVRIHNIAEEDRNLVKHFKFHSGMFDLYIIFYEIGLYMLNDKGKLGYITPNSFLRNTSQTDFRNFLIDKKYLESLFDFKNSLLFDSADTYTCICILNKDLNRNDFSVEYREYKMYDLEVKNTFSYEYFSEELYDKIWNLSSESSIDFLENNKALENKIQYIANVKYAVATYSDDIYIINVFTDKECKKPYKGKHTDENRIVYFKSKDKIIEIESGILHRCVKASKFNGVLDNTYIIFPYKNKYSNVVIDDNGEYIPIGTVPLTEDELKTKYNKAYNYLKSFYDTLSSRNMDKRLDWFLYARSQGLQESCYKKIVFKHILPKNSDKIKAYVLDEDVITYSGIYTTINVNLCVEINTFSQMVYDKYLEKVVNCFESDDFVKYCRLVGKDMGSDYICMTTKMLKDFGLEL